MNITPPRWPESQGGELGTSNYKEALRKGCGVAAWTTEAAFDAGHCWAKMLRKAGLDPVYTRKTV